MSPTKFIGLHFAGRVEIAWAGGSVRGQAGQGRVREPRNNFSIKSSPLSHKAKQKLQRLFVD